MCDGGDFGLGGCGEKCLVIVMVLVNTVGASDSSPPFVSRNVGVCWSVQQIDCGKGDIMEKRSSCYAFQIHKLRH